MVKPRLCLKDVKIIEEINKHKWIESEKQGRDIGFDVAAIDWVMKYSGQWQRSNPGRCSVSQRYVERREFRRFKWDSYLRLVNEKGLASAKVININFFGILCRVSHRYNTGARLRMHISFGSGENDNLSCIALVERVTQRQNDFEIFLRFEDFIYKKLLESDFFNKID